MTAEERAIVEELLVECDEHALEAGTARRRRIAKDRASAFRSLLAAVDASESRVQELEQKLAGVRGEASYWHDVALTHEANDFQP